MSDIVLLLLSTTVLGFTIAIPVGPITILIMRRTLTNGMLAGVSAGLGAAAADALYAAIAAFGLTGMVQLLDEYSMFLRLFGGGFLLWIAYNIWRTPPPDPTGTSPTEKSHHAQGFATIFVLTLANPLTILGFLGVFSSLDPKYLSNGINGAVILTLGITLGSFIWQNVIAVTTGMIKHALSPRILTRLNRFSALLLAGFALRIFWSLASRF